MRSFLETDKERKAEDVMTFFTGTMSIAYIMSPNLCIPIPSPAKENECRSRKR